VLFVVNFVLLFSHKLRRSSLQLQASVQLMRREVKVLAFIRVVKRLLDLTRNQIFILNRLQMREVLSSFRSSTESAHPFREFGSNLNRFTHRQD